MKKIFIISIIYVFSACFSESSSNYSMNYESKESSLESFLNSLKAGDIDSVKSVMTFNGYKSLKLYVADGEEEFAFKSMGDRWSDSEFSWRQDSNIQIAYQTYNLENAIQLNFIEVDNKWKIDKLLME